MPLIYHRNLTAGGELGVWRITETAEYFLDRLELFPQEIKQLSKIKGRLRLEWLASRWLLHTLSGRFLRGACLKDEYGKPYLTDSDFEISISHSWNIVAIMAAPYSIGIDTTGKIGSTTTRSPSILLVQPSRAQLIGQS